MQNIDEVKRNLLLLVGFLFFSTGFLSIVLSLIGFKFDFFSFLNSIGAGFAFLIYIFLVLTGIAMMYVAKSNPQVSDIE
jgi:hypothetical protein